MTRQVDLGSAATGSKRTGGAQRQVLWLVCLCQFMVILDASIINVALPSIAHDLGFADADLGWVVNGYLLPFAGLMLVAGRAADLTGPRRLLLAGVTLFTLASLAGGLAISPVLLVAARIVQGVGAAMMAPATVAVINTEFADAETRLRTLAAWAAAGGLGGTFGAVAGGLITTGLSWRWVLFINVPMGCVLVWLTMTAVRRRSRRRGPIDLLGALTATIGLGALTFGIMGVPDHGWADPAVSMPLATGLLLLVAFACVEARVATHPMVPPQLFVTRSVRAGNLAMVLLGSISIAMWYFTSLMFQNTLDYTALQAGLAQTPAAVAFMVVARWSGSRLARHRPQQLLLPASLLLIAGFGWLAAIGSHGPRLEGILGSTLLIGVGIGLAFPTIMTIATADVPAGYEGIAGGVATTAQQVGAASGLAVLTVIANSEISTNEQPAGGYTTVFLAAAAMAAAIGAIAFTLRESPRTERRVEMKTEGIEAVFLTTHDWGRAAQFFQALGFELEFEAGHNSGQFRHASGPSVFIAEVPQGQRLDAQLVLKVTDADTVEAETTLDGLTPFEDTHFGTRIATVRDPDGRTWSLQAPGSTKSAGASESA